jgi:NADPH:quinone reductase-like Zn-dependent oxidoreductase
MRYYSYLEEKIADSLTMQERDVPRPGPGQVLVRLKACSLNYRDLLIITGRYPGIDSKGLVPVSDGAGEVVEVGAGVDRFKSGDRVTGCFFETWLSGPMLPAHYNAAIGGSTPGVLSEYRVFEAAALVATPMKKPPRCRAPHSPPGTRCTKAASSCPATPCWCWAPVACRCSRCNLPRPRARR